MKLYMRFLTEDSHYRRIVDEAIKKHGGVFHHARGEDRDHYVEFPGEIPGGMIGDLQAVIYGTAPILIAREGETYFGRANLRQMAEYLLNEAENATVKTGAPTMRGGAYQPPKDTVGIR